MPAETIYALATGVGRSAIAVVRVSGTRARRVVETLAGAAPSPRQARATRLRDPESGAVLDHGLVLWFPAPRSVTGEDYAEFHVHGGRAVADAVLTALARFPGLRQAEPGEFARRGFANGKMDLSQVEALADLVDAETEFQRRQAVRALGGELRRTVEAWRGKIVQALALVEADLDFSDEEDVGLAPNAALETILLPVIAEMQIVSREAPASERMRDGYLVAILGPPNSGKSTLLNALARRDLAIVSAIPGTTRDLIEAHLDVRGMPVTFVDTAGLCEASDEVEKIGIARTLERAKCADLVLWLSEGGAVPAAAGEFDGVDAPDVLTVATKADLFPEPANGLAISAKTEFGLDRLLAEISRRAQDRLGDGSNSLLIRRRHRDAVETARANIESGLERGRPLEVVAEDLRTAGRALARIVGAVDVEQVLDAIFARFCIGK